MLVVGAGSAGSVVAARLADRCDVIVIEAGRWPPEADSGERSGAWALGADLTRRRRWTARPGRTVGGSSVVNGGYFAPPERADLDLWHAAGGPAWAPDRVEAIVAEIGAEIGVRPSPQTHPLARAFTDAGVELGHAAGLLPLQTTITDGVPRNAAGALAHRGSIEVRDNARASRIVVEDGRAIGVEVAAGDGSVELLTADDVIVCAGGFGTPRLLLASGIGPADQLRSLGIEPVHDLPGVGASFSDHPTVWVEWSPGPDLAAIAAQDAPDGAFPVALRVGADGGPGDDIELLACTRPPALEAEPDVVPPSFGMIVGLQRPNARGTIAASSSRPFAAPVISYGYLEDDRDRRALRVGVRLAAQMATSRAYAGLVDRLIDLDDETLGDDDRLDAWIEERLGSAAHASGSAPMGPSIDARAVVDGAGRVRGIRDLRIADTSILPVVPSRGPAATAMAVGAIIADQL